MLLRLFSLLLSPLRAVLGLRKRGSAEKKQTKQGKAPQVAKQRKKTTSGKPKTKKMANGDGGAESSAKSKLEEQATGKVRMH